MYYRGINQEPEIQWSKRTRREKQENFGNTSPSKESKKEKRLNPENKPFTALRTSNIPF